MHGETNEYNILVGTPAGKTPLGNLDVDGWIILKWIRKK
jgi:hypothetical protein